MLAWLATKKGKKFLSPEKQTNRVANIVNHTMRIVLYFVIFRGKPLITGLVRHVLKYFRAVLPIFIELIPYLIWPNFQLEL